VWVGITDGAALAAVVAAGDDRDTGLAATLRGDRALSCFLNDGTRVDRLIVVVATHGPPGGDADDVVVFLGAAGLARFVQFVSKALARTAFIPAQVLAVGAPLGR